jgi:hypothetical protein
MMRRTYGLAAIGCLGLGLLVGCSSGDSASDSASASAGSTAASVQKDATYDNVVALKDAAVAAGLSCTDFKETDDAAEASGSGTCGDAAVLAIYASQADQDKVLEAVKTGTEKQVVLAGPNWTIKYAKAEDLQPTLGGVILEQTGEAMPTS